MCTATWMFEDDAYELFLSRDERKTRLPGLPPSYHTLNGVTFLAPSDGQYGGSWIAVNEAGMSLAILNLYGAKVAREKPGMTSRGLLLLSLMDVQRVADLPNRIRVQALERTNPFTLLAMDLAGKAIQYRWNGNDLALSELTEADQPVSTSSIAPARVARRRRKTLEGFLEEDGSITEGRLDLFHRSRDALRPEAGICMERADAHTVSLSHIRVEDQQVSFSYRRVISDKGQFLSPMQIGLPRRTVEAPSHIRSSSPM